MKNRLLTIIFLLVTNINYSQINAVVIDSLTNEKIPFVNIWVENENIGTSSNENGKFKLDCFDNSKVIVFSAIGYETKKVENKTIKDCVKLKPLNYELSELVISAKKKNKELTIGEFNKTKISNYYGCGGYPWIVARFFEFNENINNTPFLKKIQFLTESHVKDSKFNIRLYSVNEKGEPDDYIYDKNIIVIAKKGTRITEIDLSDLHILFPKNGFFVAIEWIIIESNKYEYTYTLKDSKKKLKGISYEPLVGTIPAETDENSWIYIQGNWRKGWKNNSPLKRYKDKYILLAIELTLTN